jgi:DNA-directed RNA polymerase I subunit RPA2
MERDALIAHGTSFLLQDRLMNCSDYSTAWVCRKCGSLISLGFEELRGEGEGREYCRVCDQDELRPELVTAGEATQRKGVGIAARKGEGMDVIAVPCECACEHERSGLTRPSDVFRYLCAEMACMGIKLNVAVT